jgi:hypothetical protein
MINEKTIRFAIDRNSPGAALMKVRTNLTARTCKKVIPGDIIRRTGNKAGELIFRLAILLPYRLPKPTHSSQPEKMMPMLSSLP